MDLYAGQIQGLFDIPADNLLTSCLLAAAIIRNSSIGDDLMIVSPDVGAAVRARALLVTDQIRLRRRPFRPPLERHDKGKPRLGRVRRRREDSIVRPRDL